MVIENTGNVGIGSANPTQRIDTDGTARLRGLQAGDLSTDEVVVADANGVLKTIAASALAGEWEDDGAGGIKTSEFRR